jgi:hypothetical protein
MSTFGVGPCLLMQALMWTCPRNWPEKARSARYASWDGAWPFTAMALLTLMSAIMGASYILILGRTVGGSITFHTSGFEVHPTWCAAGDVYVSSNVPFDGQTSFSNPYKYNHNSTMYDANILLYAQCKPCSWIKKGIFISAPPSSFSLVANVIICTIVAIFSLFAFPWCAFFGTLEHTRDISCLSIHEQPLPPLPLGAQVALAPAAAEVTVVNPYGSVSEISLSEESQSGAIAMAPLRRSSNSQ